MILLAVGFGVWKLLDYFQLPNTFSIVLLILTALSGVLWCYHYFVATPKRNRKIARAEQRSGQALTDEEKAKIEPISEASEFLSSLFPVLSVVFLVRSFYLNHFKFLLAQWSQPYEWAIFNRKQIYLWHQRSYFPKYNYCWK